MKIIGITGSIASGKSKASNYILSKGFKVIDADEISRNITKKGKAGYDAIIEKFAYILDNNEDIDRKLLSDIVFKDKFKLDMLNSILHPIIFKEIDNQIERYKQEDIIFLDAPLLFETNLYKKCDEVILIYCSEDIQLKRITKRDKVTIEKAKLIIKNQMPVLKKKLKSTHIIDNSSDINSLYLKLDIVLNVIQSNN